MNTSYPPTNEVDKFSKGPAFDEPVDVVRVLGHPRAVRDAPNREGERRSPFLRTPRCMHCCLLTGGFSRRACYLFPLLPGLPMFCGLAGTNPRRGFIHPDTSRNPPHHPPTAPTPSTESHSPPTTAGYPSTIHLFVGRLYYGIRPCDSLLRPIASHLIIPTIFCTGGRAHCKPQAGAHGSPGNVPILFWFRATARDLLPDLCDLVVRPTITREFRPHRPLGPLLPQGRT